MDSHVLQGRPAKLLSISIGNVSNRDLEALMVPLVPDIVRRRDRDPRAGRSAGGGLSGLGTIGKVPPGQPLAIASSRRARRGISGDRVRSH